MMSNASSAVPNPARSTSDLLPVYRPVIERLAMAAAATASPSKTNRCLTKNIRTTFSAGVLSLLCATLMTGCQQPPEYQYLSGETMGTSYHISYHLPNDIDEAQIKAAIDQRLVQVNDSMSTYQQDSTISRFNRLGANTPIKIEADFVQVLDVSRDVYERSSGAFDPTVMPLIETWGFGSTMTVERLQRPPSAQQIAQAKSLVDFDSVIQEETTLYKTKAGVGLDFSAVAKGYGVDVIAEVLKEGYNIRNYMVEIGGEVATSGVNGQQQPWQIAIDAPIKDSSVRERQSIALIRQPVGETMHLATSGNYRNAVVFDGKRYSHTIDPTTGSPIIDGAPSITVAADSVALADAWATALTAMPYEQALQYAQDQHLAALFVIDADDQPSDSKSRSTDISGEASANVSSGSDRGTDASTAWQIVQTPAMAALRAGTSS